VFVGGEALLYDRVGIRAALRWKDLLLVAAGLS